MSYFLPAWYFEQCKPEPAEHDAASSQQYLSNAMLHADTHYYRPTTT